MKLQGVVSLAVLTMSWLSSVAVAAGGTPEQITCRVTVVDANARPVAGAEVVAYEDILDYDLVGETCAWAGSDKGQSW